jgi:transcriptional regulator with XRE-family HTH domain
MTRLEQLRIDRVLTPEQLAEATDTSARTIRRIEKRQSTNLRTLGALGKYFDVRPSELLDDVSSPARAA